MNYPKRQEGFAMVSRLKKTVLFSIAALALMASVACKSGDNTNAGNNDGSNDIPVATITVTIDPSTTHAISLYIYGKNFYDAAGDPPNLTLNRMGGNRWTAYNWENNASNSGTDWGPYSNDNYLGGGNTPAESVRGIIAEDHELGMASIMTVQMQGYAAADKNGLVVVANEPNYLTTRFKHVVYKKGSAFSASPVTSDAYVYMDEFLWVLKNKFTSDIFSASATLPTFVSLDNEPELWSSTHDILQPALETPGDYIQKAVDLTKSIKDIAPEARIFGPVHYGFNGIVNFQGASGFSSSYWFTDRFLSEMKAASETYGSRLLDAYDFHWYPEARSSGGTRVINLTSGSLTNDEIQAVVQSPRSFWDSTYTENSWITDYLGSPIYIIRRLQTKIDNNWPGTKLAITEYFNGGGNHIAGAIAQADTLGIFGSEGIFAACLWPIGACPYTLAGFRMFRSFDGADANFGDVSLKATSSDVAKVSAYVSRDSTEAGRYVIVALNRSTASQTVAFKGLNLSGTASIYRMAAGSTLPSFVNHVSVNVDSGTTFLFQTLPPLTITTLEIR
jgi:hypothetical protein